MELFIALELKDGRVPHGTSSRLGFWKTEEFQKFCFPASEVILAGLLEPQEYHIWQLVTRMTEMTFNKRNGWSHDDVVLFEKLAKRYIILLEEQRGVTACRVTVHNLLHIPGDALRFSHPDNYWCFPFERAVKRYIGHTSNFKNKECSFAQRESYRELLKLLSSKLGVYDVTNYTIDLKKMCTKSLEVAKKISNMVSGEQANSYIEGVLVGGMARNQVHLSQQDIQLIQVTTNSLAPSVIAEIAWSFRSLWKPRQTPQGMLYRVGEQAMFTMDGVDQCCQITDFFCVKVDNDYKKFVKAALYQKLLDNEGNTMTDNHSGGLLIDLLATEIVIVPVLSISRKVMIYDFGDVFPNPGTRAVIDFQRKTMPITYVDIVVPFFPCVEDMVMIQGEDPDPWLGKVSVSSNENVRYRNMSCLGSICKYA